MLSLYSACPPTILHQIAPRICQIECSHPGTGFLVTPRLLITSHRVLSTIEMARNAWARFSISKDENITIRLNPNPETGGVFVTCPSFSENGEQIFDDQHLGFTLVALEESPDLSKIPNLRQISKVSSSFFPGVSPEQNEAAYIIHYPNEVTHLDPETKEQETRRIDGQRMNYSDSAIHIFNDYLIHHSLATGSGSSGAIILNERGQPIGIHQDRCTAHENCAIAVRTDAIAQFILENNQWPQDDLSFVLKKHYLSSSVVTIFRPNRRGGEWTLELPLQEMYSSLTLIEEHQAGVEKSIELSTLFSRETLKNQVKKRVLITGYTGSGKSALCQYIAHEWAEGRLWQEYRNVFCASFLNLKKHDTYVSFLERECGKLETHHSLEALLNNKRFTEQSLLILDDLDLHHKEEALSIFKTLQEKFNHIVVISRPQTVEFDYACKLQITGFDEKAMETYISQFFKAWTKACPEELSEEKALQMNAQLQQKLRTCHKTRILAQSPINLALMCELLIDNKTIVNFDQIKISFLYNQVMNWMYQRYVRTLDKISTATIRTYTCARNIPPALPLAKTLEDIAWLNMEQGVVEQDKLEEKFNENEIDLSELQKLGPFLIENGKGKFIHPDLQDLFAASHLSFLYLYPPYEDRQNTREKIQNFIQKYKLNPRYQSIFWIAAGLLSIHDVKHKKLQAFFDDLYQARPYSDDRDEIHFLEGCFKECEQPEKIKQYEEFQRISRIPSR